MNKHLNQSKTANLVTRNKEDVLIAYIKDNYSKEIADFVKKFEMHSDIIDLSKNTVQDINGYYHYYKEGVESLKVDKNEVRDFINTLSHNELAFLTYKSGGAGYMLALPYVKGHSAEYGWKQYIQDSILYTPQLNVAKQEIHDFRNYDFGKNHDFYNARSFIDLLSDIDTSVLEQISYEKENR